MPSSILVSLLMSSLAIVAIPGAELPVTGADSLTWLLWVAGGIIVVALIIFGFRMFKENEDEE